MRTSVTSVLRWGLVGLVIAAASLGASSVLAQPGTDCSDFSTQQEAQAFFLAHGGPSSDPFGLDLDEDGIACETLPSGPASPAPPRTPTVSPTPPTTATPTAVPSEPPTKKPKPPGGKRGNDNNLPITGGRVAAYGGSGLALLAFGFVLVLMSRRHPRPAIARSSETPPWGDAPLTGW